jgi:hypothetical protein
MGVKRGLKAIRDHVDAEEARFNGSGDSGPKTVWFKVADKQTVKVLFLQELDPDSPNYSQKNDLGLLAVEHVNPKNFRKKALCSIDDEGACYGCEQHRKDYKAGWKQKTRLYINVLVDDGQKEPYVAVLSQGNGPKSITPSLIEYASDGDDPSITNKWYKIKRTGSGPTDTSYLLMPGAQHKLNVEDYELFDLSNVLREVPYAQQEAHYLDGQPDDVVAEESSATVSSTTVDAEW